MFKDKITYIFIMVLLALFLVWEYDVRAYITSGREERTIRVAILDTGIDPLDPRVAPHLCKDEPSMDFTGEGLPDRIGHGTHVFGSIVKYAGSANYCIFVYKVFGGRGTNADLAISQATYLLATKKVDIVNMSAGGMYLIENEELFIRDHPNTLYVAAAGNDNKNLDNNRWFPANLAKRYTNVLAVGNIDFNGKKASNSNYGKHVKFWEPGVKIKSWCPNGRTCTMSGSSMSCSVKTGRLIKELSK